MSTGRTADVRYTLTDVMRGIRKHGLIDRMSEECFTFLIGLILEANELGFKNPFTLTVNQALPIGGGNSRQMLSNRRKALSKVKIDGKPIIKIIAGNKGRNSAASYEIDYNLLCSYNGVWQGRTDLPSNLFDSSLPISPDGTPDGSRTIPRSEEKREEKNNNQDTSNVATKQCKEVATLGDIIIDDLSDSGKEKENGTLGNERKEFRSGSLVNGEAQIKENIRQDQSAVGKREKGNQREIENDRAAPTEHDHTTSMLPQHSKKPPGHNNTLPNGMTKQELLALLEFKVGVVKIGMDGHADMVNYLSTVPQDRLKTVIDHAVAENTAPRFGLSYIYEHCDQWDYWQKKWMLEPGAREDAELIQAKKDEEDFRELGMIVEADKMLEYIRELEG